MIKYIKGDLLEAKQEYIVHQVNCQGVMGSGVAKAIKDKYPEVFRHYKRLVKDKQISNKDLLGIVQFVAVSSDKEIVNLFSQDHYLPRTTKHTNYDAMTKGFETIKELVAEDLAMPKIGCGLGGGDWKIVSAIIESVFDDRDVYIYEL